MITIKKIETHDFRAIAEEWNAFLEKSTNNNIFLTYEWLSSWWKAFKPETRTYYFWIARDAEDNIVGGFPLQRKRIPFLQLSTNILGGLLE